MVTAVSAEVETLKNYVGGSWVDGQATETQEVRNPATDEVIARVPLSNAADVDAAVRSRRCGLSGLARHPAARAGALLLHAARNSWKRHRDELARLIVTEMGKTLDDARGEVQRGIDNVETACGIPTLMMGYGLEDGAARGIDEEVVFQPLGVCAAITPFNFPFMIAFWFWPYAVGRGNTFVLKPSEQDPIVQHRVFELIEQAGFPPGVMNLVNGGKDAVNALLDHPTIRGDLVRRLDPDRGLRLCPRVGEWQACPGLRRREERDRGHARRQHGCLPLDDHELLLRRGRSALPRQLAGAAGRRRSRRGAGAGGRGGKPIAARRWTGAGRRPGAGRLGGGARPHLRRDHERRRGRCGGGARRPQVSVPERPKGYFVGPTLLDQVRPEMRVYQEEIFGPVVGMTPVDSLDEAIAMINAAEYGNAASIFTESGAAAAPIPLRGRDRQHRDQRRCGRAGRLLPVQRRQALILRHAPSAGARRGALLHREQGGHHPLDDRRRRDGHRGRPIVRERRSRKAR